MEKTDISPEVSLTKTFPTIPDADGYFFEHEEDEDLGIRSYIHKNGNQTKTVTLRDGKVYVVRELTGRDTKSIARFQGKDQERYLIAAITVATTVDGSAQTFEYFEGMKYRDLSKLYAMHGDLNF